MILKEFVAFIKERWVIHQRRLSGAPPPWTKDPLLQRYKFCNVRREDDRTTRWIHENWLRPHTDDPDLWFSMYVARVFNRISTLAAIGYPVPWTAKRPRVLTAANALKGDGVKVFSAAYMIHSMRTPGPYRPKINYYGELFTATWAQRRALRPTLKESLQEFYERLMTVHGFGNFMAAQVIADYKWSRAGRKAPDWETFAASGPGSRRGLNRLLGRDLRAPWKELNWRGELSGLRYQVLHYLPEELRSLDAQNLQNCLCEFDKYRRAVDGGRPKQNFKPSEEKY